MSYQVFIKSPRLGKASLKVCESDDRSVALQLYEDAILLGFKTYWGKFTKGVFIKEKSNY